MSEKVKPWLAEELDRILASFKGKKHSPACDPTGRCAVDCERWQIVDKLVRERHGIDGESREDPPR